VRYPVALPAVGVMDTLRFHRFTIGAAHVQSGDAPVLTRIETAAGHGVGRPTRLEAAEWADLLTFAAHHTGLRPPVAVGGAE